MGRRYFCEYCDRAFADTPPSRKRHIKSLQHQRLKKLHYDSFKDAATLLAEEAQKAPCKKFFQTGECKFGDNCKFSHVSPQFYQSQMTDQNPVTCTDSFDVESWVSNWRKKHPDKGKESRELSSKYWLPPGFPPLNELPPSLHPTPKTPKGHVSPEDKVEWGADA
eukprot:Seg2875.6 transcript_id=Seg2875.6/GoldUCD/mRNA.D3Y31 product="Zinc finger matrin-type protein 5" protein_id=Seg2875.6/GoldUCD/D3Y31